MAKWKNRIVGQGSKPADQFLANELNWRTHPENQRRAVKASLDTVGWVQQVIENKRTGRLIDGHERVWQALDNNNADVPYIEVDLTEEEEIQALATLDPLSSMASVDPDKLTELLGQVQTDNLDLQLVLNRLRQELPNDYDPLTEWKGMPEFESENLRPFRTMIIHFPNREAVAAFAELINQKFTEQTKSIWYPERPEELRNQTGAGMVFTNES